MKRKILMRALLGAGTIALLIVGPTSFAADTSEGTAKSSGASATEANQLISEFSTFAGSTANATALVTGLRTGSSITLTSGGTSTTFTAPTRPMGYGNVDIALALAQASLSKLGVTSPTPQQLQAALTGGTVNGTALTGILTLRSEGKGWGEIAKSLGLNLGQVVSSTKIQQAESEERAERQQRPERPQKPERPMRPARPFMY